jgi:hypothetical protein
MLRSPLRCALPLLASLLLGCGATRGFVADTAAAAVDEGVGELSQEEQRDELARILGDRELRRETREIARELVDAAISSATTEERAEAVTGLLRRFGTITGTEIGVHTGRSLATTMVAQLDEALANLSTEGSRERIALLTATVTRTLLEVFADGMRDHVGPAMREVVRQDVALGIEQALDERLTDAFANTSRIVAREAVIGAGEGLEELEERGDIRLLRSMSGTLEEGEDLAEAAVFGVGLLIGLLAAGIVLAVIALRRAKRGAGRTRDALLTLITAIKGTEREEWSGELCDALKRGLRDNEGAELVRDILRARPDLRLCPGVRDELEDDSELPSPTPR